ncbi:unnamed protein product [Staurois parvus]|uniref:Uncharacterized protein n=1 Tax=Staurois parvus TaxID=386267 RepID=A0ABN9BRC7_9NEOB|nr:unnamed protein product [Staurois parvus]
MVPSICPLETLHNSLSLKQVDEFLAAIAAPSSDCLLDTPTASPCTPGFHVGSRKVSLNTYTPTKILPTPLFPSMDLSSSSTSTPYGGGASNTISGTDLVQEERESTEVKADGCMQATLNLHP